MFFVAASSEKAGPRISWEGLINSGKGIPVSESYRPASSQALSANVEACLDSSGVLAKPFSRRAFFCASGVVGALTFLGSAFGGRIMAFADEAGNTSFVVNILSRKDIVVLATDVANDMRVVSGMKIVLRSLDNDKVVEGETDDHGVLTLRIADLADGASSYSNDYTFWGRISAYKDGYREYENYRVLVKGGPLPADSSGKRQANIQVPTRPVGSDPYVRLAAFDDDDIQYGKATFPVCDANTATHTVTMQVMADQGTPVTGWLTANGEVVAGPQTLTAHAAGGRDGLSSADAATAAQSTGATFEFQGTYLCDLPVGAALKGHFSVDGTTRGLPFTVSFSEPAGGLPTILVAAGQETRVFASTSQSSESKTPSILDSDWSLDLISGTLTLPSSWPVVGGAKLSLDLPLFPLDIILDPQGGFGFALGTDTIFLRYRHKNFDPNDWCFMSRETLEEYRGRTTGMFMDAFKRYDRALDAWKDKTGKTHSPTFGGVDSRVDFGIQITGNYDYDEELYLGDAVLAAELLFKFVKGKQFVFGPVPVFISLDFSSVTTVSILLPLSMRPWSSLPDPSLGKMLSTISLREPNEKEGGFGATIEEKLTMGISLGLGVSGLISVAARGYGFVSVTFEFVDTLPDPSYGFPHRKVSAGVGVQVVVQVLLFKGTFDVAKKVWKRVYDNWPAPPKDDEAKATSLLAASNDGVELLGADVVYSDATEEMQMVTDGEMCGVAEFTAAVSRGGLARASYTNESATGKAILESDLGFDEVYERRMGDVSLQDDEGKDGDEDDGWILLYDPTDGVRPNIEKVIFSDVISDPRVKLVVVDGVRYLCRIVAVDVNGSAVSLQSTDGEDGAATSGGYTLMKDKDGVAFFVADGASDVATLAANGADGATDESAKLVWNPDTCAYEVPDDVQAASDVFLADLGVFPDSDDEPEAGVTLQSADLFADASNGIDLLSPVAESSSADVGRCRVAISRFSNATGTWSAPAILEFGIEEGGYPQYSRVNTHDVDFDVMAAAGYSDSDDGATLLHFAITSCARPLGEDKTLENQGKLQYVTYIAVDPKRISFNGTIAEPVRAISYLPALVKYDTPMWNARIEEVVEGGEKHMLFAALALNNGNVPRIQTVWTKGNSSWEIHRSTVSPERVDSFSFGSKGVMNLSTNEAGAALACLTNDDRSGSIVIGLHKGMKSADAVFARIGSQGIPSSAPESGFIYTQTTGQTDSSGAPEKRVMLAGVDPSTGRGFADDEIGRTTASTIFTSPKGGYLFAVRNLDTRVLPDEADAGEQVRLYQVLAANVHDKTLSSYGDFYPFAQLDMPIDDIACIDANWGAASFCYTTIKDISTLRADIHHVVVPFVEGLSLANVSCTDSFCGPGDACNIAITVANTGNLPILGYTAHIWDAPNCTGNELATVKVSVADNIVSRLEGYKEKLDSQGAPTGEFGDDSAHDESYLYPGASRTNAVSFTLPEKLSGQVTLHVTIDDVKSGNRHLDTFSADDSTSLLTNGDVDWPDDDEIFSLIDPESERFSFDASCEVSASELLGRGDYDIEQGGVPGGGSGGGSGSGSGSGSGGGAAADVLSPTGDSMSLTGLAAGALASAAVAGVSWYERRRAENERGGEESL